MSTKCEKGITYWFVTLTPFRTSWHFSSLTSIPILTTIPLYPPSCVKCTLDIVLITRQGTVRNRNSGVRNILDLSLLTVCSCFISTYMLQYLTFPVRSIMCDVQNLNYFENNLMICWCIIFLFHAFANHSLTLLYQKLFTFSHNHWLCEPFILTDTEKI